MFFSKIKTSRLLAGVLAVQMVATSIPAGVMAAELTDEFATEIVEVTEATLEEPGVVTPAVTEIPGTYSKEMEFNKTFNSVVGYASVDGAVKDRSEYIDTEYHKKVNDATGFFDALKAAREGKVKIIELTADIDLGYNQLSEEQRTKTYKSFVSSYKLPSVNSSMSDLKAEYNGFTNAVALEKGVSSVKISETNGLTIFSKNGYSISRAELNINRNAKDIVIRNIHFKDMWQWDDDLAQKAVGWSNLKLNEGHDIWIDHCTFDPAFDGNIDIENGASGISITWCKIGIEPEEATKPGNAIYDSITFMEGLYNAGKLTKSSSYYKKFRDAGATAEDVMKFCAYHDKCHLCGSGDKDCIDYSDAIKDSNGNIRLTLAYNHYISIGQRLPMIRQGSGHLINCYIDDTQRQDILSQDIFKGAPSNYRMSRCINARNGASIAADTCVFDGVEQAVIGAECQGQDLGNITNVRMQTFFKNAINHSLVVNSKVINSKGTYVGSSWDNNGTNAFTSNFTWNDKSTIGNWAWSNKITNYNGYTKAQFEGSDKNNPIDAYEFDFYYDPDETLPYAYLTLPLESVKDVVTAKAGINSPEMADMTAAEWCAVSYGENDINTVAGVTANSVYEKIEAIGTVEYTKDCKSRIDAARTAYNCLPEAVKETVSNNSVLSTAIVKYNGVDNAVKVIDAIGTVAYTEECKSKIDAAQAAYAAVSEELKLQVSNYAVLVNATLNYNSVDDVIKKIDAIGTVTYTEDCKAKIDEAKLAYENVSEDLKTYISNYESLTQAVVDYNCAEHQVVYNITLAPANKKSSEYSTTLRVDYGEGVSVNFVDRFRDTETNKGPWAVAKNLKNLTLVKPGAKNVENKTYIDFVKTGYTFKGWNYRYYVISKGQKTEKVKAVTALNEKIIKTIKGEDDKTLVPADRPNDIYANWIENTYNVNYQLVNPDKKAKIVKLKDEKKKVKLKNLTKVGYETTTVTLPDDTYISCEGYKLAGWTTDVAAKKNPVKEDLLKVSPGATIIEPATTHTKLAGDIKKNNKVVFYAVWEKVDDK